MRGHIIYSIFFIYVILMTSHVESWRLKRGVSNTVEDVLGIKGKASTNKRKKQPVKVTPPLRLSPGETAEQPPGWKHCIKNVRAALNWKVFKSPGYPDFLESQIQCSWILEAPIGMRVKIAFRDLDMIGSTGSCAKQFVQIIDIATGKSQGRYCGGQRPGDYVTLGTKARIDLQADKAVTKVRGFLISFSAVKEIPGFRSSKTFPTMSKGGDGAPGKVDIKSFISKASNGPKSAPGSKRASKRLRYESDINPDSTDPSLSSTESPSGSAGGNSDGGWIGDDGIGGVSSGRNRAPSNAPLKVKTGNRQRQRPQPTNNGPVLITYSTNPVRIRAKNVFKPTPSPSDEEEIEVEDQGPIIYGEHNQPFEHYQGTLAPKRGNSYIDHRPEILTTTNLIIIVVCGGLFLLMLCALIIFFCIYRKRRLRRKKREADRKRKEEEQKRESNGMELNVINLSEDGDSKFREMELNRMGRQRELPSAPLRGGDSPPRYPGCRSLPRDGAMDRPLPHRYDDGYREVPNHVLSRHEDPRRHNELRHNRRSFEPDMQRRTGYEENKRHHTIDPRRHQTHMTSQIRHQSLDPRQLERDYNMRKFSDRNSAVPREKDEDYVSGGSEGSITGRTAMRREYSPWELEQQKKERRIKLINGEL